MAGLSIRLLGPFQVTLDGDDAIGFRSDKVRALLAYLCAETGRPHRREHLAGLLWPEWPDQSARTNLRQSLANLRQVIDDQAATPPFLLISRQTIQFDQASDAWVDLLAFSELTVPTQGHATVETIGRLREAVELYRGEFLEGFSLPDSPPFEEWALLQREQSRRLVMEALHRLIDAYAEHGKLDEALERTWRLLELAPWREEAHRQAMRLLALTGQRSAALTQYETCRRLLEEELGVEPSPETTSLYEKIRGGALEVAAAPRPSAPAHPQALPASLVPFVGRKSELKELRELLVDPACRLLTLVGPGGSGKTRLAVEAAAPLVDQFAHGVHFISLAPVESVQAIVPTVAQVLRFPFSPAAEGGTAVDPEQQLLGYLQSKTLLLIMDNFEHLLEGTGVVTRILRGAPGVKVLVTSRARLNARGERLVPVRGMDHPSLARDSEAEAAQPKDVAQYSAVSLFLQGARRARPDLQATGHDLKAIAQVCRLVQGMPLGILLAAAWIELLSPAEVAVEIERSLDFLETGWRDVPHRQRSLRGVFDHSWALLTDREREAFRRLSVFRGGFTREAAEQVGASLRDLRGLVGKSFLQQSTDARRYDVHELLRQYGSEKLAGSPEDSASARDGHAAHFAVALESFVDDMRGPRQQEAVAEIEAESENLRVAWMWAVERGRVDWLDHGIEGLARFYWRRGRYQEGEAAFRAASDRLSAGAGPALRPSDSAAPSGHRLRVMAKVLAWQGFFTYALGRRQLAREMQQESLALLERPELANEDTRAEQAMLYQQMGQIVLVTDYKLSGQLQEQSLALYRTLDDPWSEADALHHLGYASKFRGAYVDARAALEECLKSFEALGDYEGTAWVTASLADVAVDQGRFEEAERLARDSRARLQALGEPEGIGFGLLALGVALEHQGKFVEARSALAESLSTFDELGRPGWTNDTRAALSRVNLGLGQYQEARTHARTFLALARDAGVQYRVGLALFTLGGVALVEEAYAEARRLLREGLIIYREAGPPPAAVWAHALMAYAARGLGEPALARDRLAEALGAFSETGSVPYLLWSLPAAALVLADQGACHRAIEVYALASRYPLVGKSRWFDDVAGRWIAAVAAALPPREAAAARERGRALDLEATQEALLGELREAEHEPG